MCVARCPDPKQRLYHAFQEPAAIRTPANSGDTDFSPTAAPTSLTDNKTSGRVDYNSHLGLLTGYYFFDQYRQSVPNIFLPGFGSDFTGRSQVVNLGDSKTLGAASVNELRFGFTRLRYLIHKPTGGTGVTPASLGFEKDLPLWEFHLRFLNTPMFRTYILITFHLGRRAGLSGHRNHGSGHG